MHCFNHISIIGTGLIGGSVGLAVKARLPKVRVTGFDRPDILRAALHRRAIDVAAGSLRDAVEFADLIIIAAPIASIPALLPRIARHASAHAIVTDTASVKAPIIRTAAPLFPDGRFIGGHPMAGTEFSGIRAANPLLFENAYWILTPTDPHSTKRQKTLAQFYATLGARVVALTAEEHDATMAMLSHVPQLTAVALTRSAGKLHEASKRHVTLGAGGFRDLTRIASSPFGMWEQILDANRAEVRKALRTMIRELQTYERSLHRSPGALATAFRDAARIREQIPRGMKGFLSPLVEFTAFVPDKPGMLAKLTTALAREGVNLKDLELLKVREGRGGTFRIAVESEQDRRCAERVVKRLFPEAR